MLIGITPSALTKPKMVGSGSAPAGPTDPNFASVSALLHFDGNFTDVKGNTWTGSGDAAATATGKFGNALIGDGAGDRVTGPDTAAFDISTGDFTVEFWCKNIGNGGNGVLQIADGGWAAIFGYSSGAGNLQFYATSAVDVPWDISLGQSMGSYPGGVWTHYAVVREGNTFSTYFGTGGTGSRVSTWSSSATIYMPSGGPHILGYRDPAGTLLYTSGEVDDLRITKGVARYSGATYTVPTAAFPDA